MTKTLLPTIHKRAQLGLGICKNLVYFCHLSIEDNIPLVLEQTNIPRREWQALSESPTEGIPAWKSGCHKGIQVSGGERRRTEWGKARVWQLPQNFCFGRTICRCWPIAVAEIQKIVASFAIANVYWSQITTGNPRHRPSLCHARRANFW